MVELAESIPNHEQLQKGPIQYLYAFALSRRNQKGDRDSAVAILERVRFLISCSEADSLHVCHWLCFSSYA